MRSNWRRDPFQMAKADVRPPATPTPDAPRLLFALTLTEAAHLVTYLARDPGAAVLTGVAKIRAAVDAAGGIAATPAPRRTRDDRPPDRTQQVRPRLPSAAPPDPTEDYVPFRDEANGSYA